jgi:hypothetical protein
MLQLGDIKYPQSELNMTDGPEKNRNTKLERVRRKFS